MQGEILINGERLSLITKSQVSYLDELKDFTNSEKLSSIITFYERMYPDFDCNRAQELMDFMALDNKLRLKSLSTGNRQKSC